MLESRLFFFSWLNWLYVVFTKFLFSFLILSRFWKARVISIYRQFELLKYCYTFNNHLPKFNIYDTKGHSSIVCLLIHWVLVSLERTCTTQEKFDITLLLSEKCPNSEFFLVRILPYSEWIRKIWTRKKLDFRHFSCSV